MKYGFGRWNAGPVILPLTKALRETRREHAEKR
jgi:hypothetical protein